MEPERCCLLNIFELKGCTDPENEVPSAFKLNLGEISMSKTHFEASLHFLHSFSLMHGTAAFCSDHMVHINLEKRVV